MGVFDKVHSKNQQGSSGFPIKQIQRKGYPQMNRALHRTDFNTAVAVKTKIWVPDHGNLFFPGSEKDVLGASLNTLIAMGAFFRIYDWWHIAPPPETLWFRGPPFQVWPTINLSYKNRFSCQHGIRQRVVRPLV